MAMAAAGEERKKTACVTGGNGYIGSALIKMLLEKGYAVKTMVENPSSVPAFSTKFFSFLFVAKIDW